MVSPSLDTPPRADRDPRGVPPAPLVAAAFAAGVAAAGLRAPDVEATRYALPACVALVACVAAAVGSRQPRRRRLLWCSVFLLLGVWRGAQPSADPAISNAPAAAPVRVRARVISAPIETRTRRPTKSEPGAVDSRASDDAPRRFVARVAVAGTHRAIPLLTVVPHGAATTLPAAGDAVLIRARARRLPASPVPLLVCPHPALLSVVADAPPRARSVALRAREALARRAREVWRGDAGGLLASLLVGDRRTLPDRTRRSLDATGTWHFLAISGLHVGILLAAVVRAPLPRRGRTALLIGLLVVYGAVTGASPPVVRAALMASIGLVTGRFGRRIRAIDALGWTGLAILAVDPMALRTAGFQLSFAAVGGILLWSPCLAGPPRDAKRFTPPSRRGPLGRAVSTARRALAASVAATVATAPLVAWWFERFHALAPLWSLAIFPLAAAALGAGFAGLALATIAPGSEALAKLPASIAAELLLDALDLAARVPGGCLRVPRPSILTVAALGGVLVLGPSRRTRPLARVLAGLTAATTLGIALRGPSPMLVSLDVGAGDAALVVAPGGQRLLVDAGGRGGRAGERLVRALLDRGVARLDAVFLTHADSDHTAALPAVLDALPVGAAYLPRGFARRPSGRAVRAALEARGVPTTEADRGARWRFAGDPDLVVDALGPDPRGPSRPAPGSNDASLALRFTIGPLRALFPGDLEEPGLAALLTRPEELRSDRLLLPHHGRRNTLLPALIGAARPGTIVISGDGAGGARELARSLARAGHDVRATWEGDVVTALDAARPEPPATPSGERGERRSALETKRAEPDATSHRIGQDVGRWRARDATRRASAAASTSTATDGSPMDALIIVDLQNDFLPGGPLAVPDGDAVVPVASRLARAFDIVVATRDWHPPHHVSFAAEHPGHEPGERVEVDGLEQILWPTHCVQDTPGAEFAPGLATDEIDVVVSKGDDPRLDSYSGFFDNGRRGQTGLERELRTRGIEGVALCGLATDVCVRWTALDAVRLGFDVTLVSDACRGVDLEAGDVDRALEEMRDAGVRIVDSATVLAELESASAERDSGGQTR